MALVALCSTFVLVTACGDDSAATTSTSAAGASSQGGAGTGASGGTDAGGAGGGAQSGGQGGTAAMGGAAAGGEGGSAGAAGGGGAAPSPGQPALVWSDSATGNPEIHFKRWDGAAWQQLAGSADSGGISDTAASSISPALALDAAGNPVVAWIEDVSEGEEVYVRRWNGAAWEELGGSATGGGISNLAGPDTLSIGHPSVAVDSLGRVVVAWWFAALEGGVCCNSNVYVRRWDGAVWEELAGSASGNGVSGIGDAGYPTLAVDPADRPLVAWNQSTSTTCHQYLRRYDGSSWEELDGSATNGGVSSAGGGDSPTLIIGRDGHPVIAWPRGLYGQHRVRRWDGTMWLDFDTGAGSTWCGTTAYPLAVDADDRPVIAWHNPMGVDDAQVDRWNGAAWESLPGDFAEDTGALGADLAGSVFFAWGADLGSEQEIYLRRWDGSTWVEMAGSATAGGISNTPAGQSGGVRLVVFQP